jgi:putative ubiquitin-RnfH superfamily antitoxin RatB of RatAB toxin-antitoxin module
VRVELVWSPGAADVRHRWLTLEEGDAGVGPAGLRGLHGRAHLPLEQLRLGIWGRVRPLDTPLRERDRIEVYRPLTVDPKEARRQRYAKRGERIVSRHRPKRGLTRFSGTRGQSWRVRSSSAALRVVHEHALALSLVRVRRMPLCRSRMLAWARAQLSRRWAARRCSSSFWRAACCFCCCCSRAAPPARPCWARWRRAGAAAALAALPGGPRR